MRRWMVVTAVAGVAAINLAMFGGLVVGASGAFQPAREVHDPSQPTRDAHRAIFSERIAPLLDDDAQGMGWFEDDGRTRVLTVVRGRLEPDTVAEIEKLGGGMYEDLRIEWTDTSMNDLYRAQAVVAPLVREASSGPRTSSAVGLGVVDSVSVIDVVMSPAAYAALEPRLELLTAADLAGLDPSRIHFTVVEMPDDPSDRG